MGAACFYVTNTRYFESFHYFIFKISLFKTKAFLRKLEDRLLLETTKNENFCTKVSCQRLMLREQNGKYKIDPSQRREFSY